MNKYIDADKLKEKIDAEIKIEEEITRTYMGSELKANSRIDGLNFAKNAIDNMPVFDEKLIRYRKLTDLTFGRMYNDPSIYGKCSVCGAWNLEKDTYYCKNCGAKL